MTWRVPLLPVELDLITGVGVDVELARGGGLVAVDVRSAHRVRLDETVILVKSIPASVVSPLVGGKVVPRGVRSRSPLSIDSDA